MINNIINKKNATAYFFLMLAPLFWASNTVIARAIGYEGLIPPIGFAFWRWLIASLFLILSSQRRIISDWDTIKKYWSKICLMSFLGIAGFNALLYSSLCTISAINGGLILCTMPIVVIMFRFFIYKDKVTLFSIIGTLFCFIGVSVTLTNGFTLDIFRMNFIHGDLLMLLATVLYGIYSSLVPALFKKIHPITFLTVASVVGTGMLAPLYVIELFFTGSFKITLDIVLNLLYVAIFPSIIAYLCWNKGLNLIGSFHASLFINLIPIYTAFLAIILLKESFHLYHLISLIMILIGIILSSKIGVKN